MDFDNFAGCYDAELQKGLAVTGEDKDYFARERVRWLRKLYLEKGIESPKLVLDFGCGDGGSVGHLGEQFRAGKVMGVDVSPESLRIGTRKYQNNNNVKFELLSEFRPNEEFDLVFTNGVFHHIPLAERAEAVETIKAALRPGGYLAFWENNPWNPGTRYVMSRVPFDKDAILVYPSIGKRLLLNAGLKIEERHFLFVFPAVLKRLRGLEPMLSRLPLGGQYLLLCRKK